MIDAQIFNNTEAITKVRDIIAGSSAALSSPVSFTTRAVMDNVTGVSLKATSASLVPASMGTIQSLTGVAQRMGSEIPVTVADVNSLLSSVGTQLNRVTTGAQSVMASVINQANNIVPNVLNSTVSTALSAINSTSIGGGILDGLTTVSNLYGMANHVVNTLPGQLINSTLGIVKGKVADTLSNTDILSSAIKSLTPEFVNYKGVDLPSMIADMYSFGVYNDGGFRSYPRYTDRQYQNLPSVLGSNRNIDTRNIGNVNEVLNGLCKGKRLDSMFPFGLEKDKYDLLAMLMSLLGMHSGLSGLLDCDKLFDTRSYNVLTNYSRPVTVNNGDPYTYGAIIDAIGDSTVADPKRDLLYMNANMTLNPAFDNVAAKTNSYLGLVDRFSTTVGGLVEGVIARDRFDTVDSVKVATMAKSNTEILQSNIEDSVIKTALGSMIAWN